MRRWWRHLPFAQKLAGLLITLVSLPIVVVVVYSDASSQEALIAATRARDLERAQATAQVIEAFFNDVRADVRTASSLATIVDLCEQPEATGRYESAWRSVRAMRTEQRMLAMYVTDRSGRVLVASDARAPRGSLQTGRAFLSAIAGTTTIDGPVYDPFDQKVALRVSHAVRSEGGEIIGTTTGIIDVTAVDDLTREDANYGGAGEFGVLWTSIGLRLSHSSDPRWRLTPWTPLPPDAQALTQQRLGPAFASGETFDPGYGAVVDRGQWLLYDSGTGAHLRVVSQQLGALQMTAVPLRNLRWVYGIFVPEQQLLLAVRDQMLGDWAVAFFTVLAALTLSLIAARWVTRPLRAVTDTANALASGDMTRRVRLEQGDEFGQLGMAFDAMASALSEKEQQLQAYAADLERRVDERTATLQLFERASRLLASSLELRRTAANLAALLVPSAADFCSIEVRDLNGNLKRVACRHADPARERIANEFADVRPAREPPAAFTAEERAALGLTAVRVYELSAGRQLVGHLTIAMAGSNRVIEESGERVFEELGRRAGLALANALLFQEAQDANRLKDEFLGVVSHELRTPLNAIVGWTRLAGMSREAGVDIAKALDAVDRNARALARLVDDLLDVPRIMMGKLALDVRSSDLVAIVRASVEAIRPAAAGKRLSVDLLVDPPTAPIDADPHRLEQVFSNVLTNAVKFTPAGGRITVRLWSTADAFVVVIEDTGVGITQEFLPFVFDRFRQADSSTTRAHGGLGIGLSLVRQLVEMHGGQVTAASEGPGRGSVFTVRLPVTSGESPLVAAHAEASAEDPTIARLHGMRLLVLDDDPDSREVATHLLAASGAIVQTAATVAEALGVLTGAPGEMDAVLADIGMPEDDGYVFIEGLRTSADARLRTLPAVAVTAYASRTDRARALSAGFDAHVPKPVSLVALADAVADAVSARIAR